MTQSPQDRRDDQTVGDEGQGNEGRGEVLISGLDTGPSLEECENVTPTDEHARLRPLLPHKEPEDEDG